YVDDLDSEVAAILDETIAVFRRDGAHIVQVELPDQRQLTAACQLVLAVEAAAFHKRWLIERPQDYGPQVLMRLQNGLAIPAVSTRRGLPVGMQLIGRSFEEAMLLRIGAAFQRATAFHERVPAFA